MECSNWDGPLFEIGTASSTGTFNFNGNGQTLNGQGPSYWDGKGTNGGVTKPVSKKSKCDPFYQLLPALKSIRWLKSPMVEEHLKTLCVFFCSHRSHTV